LLLAVVALVPQLGFPTTASTPLWSDHALPAAPTSVPAPNWVELAKRLKPAVVNISTKRIEAGMPEVGRPPGGTDDPFPEFFGRFFDQRRTSGVSARASSSIRAAMC
jgi:S1-C subfamily serine protease